MDLVKVFFDEFDFCYKEVRKLVCKLGGIVMFRQARPERYPR